MYEPIDQELLDSSHEPNDVPMPPSSLTNEERDFFTDAFLSKYLGEDKLREKDSLRDKIKFKKHQLDLATKHLKKAKQRQQTHATGLLNKDAKFKRRNPVLSCKVRKSLKMYKLNTNQKLDYCKYEVVNNLWKNYAHSCLLTCMPLSLNNLNADKFSLNEESVLNCLKVLDYHGCHLTVTQSTSKSQIGLSGIVLQDKKNVFYLITKENKIIVVPKNKTLFEFKLFDTFKMTLVGSNMCYRPEMRSTKHAKIKTKTNIK